MFNFDITEMLMTAFVFLFALTIHEYSHGLVSTLQGDDTPERYGRLTMNPLAHIDIIGFITLLLFHFGWAKPVPISSRNYKNPRLGIILTSLAGPFSNLLIAFIGLVLLQVLPYSIYNNISLLGDFLWYLVSINTMLAVFNLIPIPPLDGSKIFAEIFGGKIAQLIYSIEKYGMIILIIILQIPYVNHMLTASITAVIKFLARIVIKIF